MCVNRRLVVAVAEMVLLGELCSRVHPARRHPARDADETEEEDGQKERGSRGAAAALRASAHLHIYSAPRVPPVGHWLSARRRHEKCHAMPELAHHALGAAWLMINGSDDRYQILAATGLNIDPILVVGCPDAKYWHILAENLIYRQFRVIFHNKN